MKKFIIILLASFILAGVACSSRYSNSSTVGQGPDISVEYLQEARKFRAEGRYDLARQSYALALSTCRNNANLEIIKHELAGTELLIRTMR